MQQFFELYPLEQFTKFLEFFLKNQSIFAPPLLLLIEEAGIPLPIPGDVVLAYTGYQVAKGTIAYVVAYLTTLLAILIGSSILYFFSARYGQQIVVKFGSYLHLNEKKLVFIENKFRKYGIWFIIVGRHIPGMRVPLSIFAGMSQIRYKTFIISTLISVVFWIPVYLSLGEHLGAKTIKLMQGNQLYFLIAFIPFIIFIISIIFSARNQNKKVQIKVMKVNRKELR